MADKDDSSTLTETTAPSDSAAPTLPAVTASADPTNVPAMSDQQKGSGTYGAGSVAGQQKLINTLPPPTGQQDIEAMLAPYMKEIYSLGPEYQQEMEFLKPYLSPEHQTFNQVVDTSKQQESSTGNTAVNAADAAASSSIENQPAPGFGGVAAGDKQYVNSLGSTQQIQAALGYQKWLSTYGGQTANTTGWTPQEVAAYQSIVGSSGINGLPSISSAAAANNAQNQANSITQQISQGGTQGGGNV